ncbi:MAG: hypothetical protein AABW83_03460 [Nanoarchaeota archaeon]
MKKSKESLLSILVNLAVWTTGILVSLAVGFGMTENGTLNQSIPWLSQIGDGVIVSIAGWIVVILTLVSIILAIIDKSK